jgi:hypothetical protein
MSVTRNFPVAVPDDVRSWTKFWSSLFFARTFTAILAGCTVDQTGTARYTASAGIVALHLPGLSGTSNSVLAFLDGLPDEITPAHDQLIATPVIDNGVYQMGLIKVGLDSTVTLYSTLASGAWTAAGAKGIVSNVVVYPLD